MISNYLSPYALPIAYPYRPLMNFILLVSFNRFLFHLKYCHHLQNTRHDSVPASTALHKCDQDEMTDSMETCHFEHLKPIISPF